MTEEARKLTDGNSYESAAHIPGVEDPDALTWETPAGSPEGKGVMIAKLPDGRVLMKSATGPIVVHLAREWAEFQDGIKAGDFGLVGE